MSLYDLTQKIQERREAWVNIMLKFSRKKDRAWTESKNRKEELEWVLDLIKKEESSRV